MFNAEDGAWCIRQVTGVAFAAAQSLYCSWSLMSEADRVFARMITAESRLEPEKDTQVLHITTRRQRGAVAGQSRTVEVVHRRSERMTPSSEPEQPPRSSAHAATWPDGFPARSAPIPAPAASLSPAPAPSPPQVGHVMPGWEPLLTPVQPDAPVAQPAASPRRQPRVAKQLQGRRFADPFDAEDNGANCIRCGYLVEPAREERGLLTCGQCR